jgi:hypothetical protein
VIATPVRMVLRELLAASDGAPPTAETPKITLPAGTEGAPPAPASPAVPPAPPTTPARPVMAAVRDLVREPVRSPVTGPAGTPVIPEPALAAPADGIGAAAETAVIPMPDPALVPDRGPSRREIRLARTLDELTDHDAGWYLDPGDDGMLRWWSGSAWGAATYPVQRVDTPTPTRGRTHDAALSTPS